MKAQRDKEGEGGVWAALLSYKILTFMTVRKHHQNYLYEEHELSNVVQLVEK
jgi:hypothetical protein